MKKLEKRVGEAIKLFWLTRDRQRQEQGSKSGQKDAGLRAAVTGGKHLDGFTQICHDLFIDAAYRRLTSSGKIKRSCPASIVPRRIGTW
jgi:hypothetical protein